jgi:hypothetical protein
MVRAVDPAKVNNVADIANAYKRKIPNVSLNLNTGKFDIKNAKGAVAKSISVRTGYDAAYVINSLNNPALVKSSGDLLQERRDDIIENAGHAETAFADTQDELLRVIEAWKGLDPGASRTALTKQIGRLQRQLASEERDLRNKQYLYRENLEVEPARRRLYAPASNDERVIPHAVWKLNQYQNVAKGRVVE